MGESEAGELRGGSTGVKKMASIAEAYGVRCEIHISGFGNLQILGATSEDTCEYYECGLLAPGVTCDAPPPYLNAICDPLDSDGYVTVPQGGANRRLARQLPARRMCISEWGRIPFHGLSLDHETGHCLLRK